MAVQHLPGGVGEVGQLQQQKPCEELATDSVEADHGSACHCDQRRHQCPGVEASVQGIFDQRHVQRRQDGEQQHLRHGEHAEAQVQADVGNAVLQCADHQHSAHERGRYVTPAGQRQKDQTGQQYSGEHGEVAVDVAGEVFADHVEGERLDERDDD